MNRRKQGRVISKIEYHRDGHKVTVDLRLTEQGGKFIYIIDHDEPRIQFRHEDANTVKSYVMTELERLLTIQWKDVICIQVEANTQAGFIREKAKRPHLTATRELKLDVETCQVGTTNTGKLVHRETPWLGLDGQMWNPRISEGLPHILHPNRNTDVTSQAMIDDTPENRAKVKAVQQGIDLLSKQLADLLGQEKIVTTLESVRVLGLPAPAPKGKA